MLENQTEELNFDDPNFSGKVYDFAPFPEDDDELEF